MNKICPKSGKNGGQNANKQYSEFFYVKRRALKSVLLQICRPIVLDAQNYFRNLDCCVLWLDNVLQLSNFDFTNRVIMIKYKITREILLNLPQYYLSILACSLTHLLRVFSPYTLYVYSRIVHQTLKSKIHQFRQSLNLSRQRLNVDALINMNSKSSSKIHKIID